MFGNVTLEMGFGNGIWKWDLEMGFGNVTLEMGLFSTLALQGFALSCPIK